MATTVPLALLLRGTKAPNQPIAPVEYDQRFQDQFSNVLRLYFNTIDNFTSALTDTAGGSNLRFPHIAAQDTTDQYATATNTPTKVLWNTLDSGDGFTLNVDSTATASYGGVYKIDFSIQFSNTDNALHDSYLWLRVNNVDLPGSSSKFTIAARKSAGVPSHLVGYSSVTFEIEAGDSIGLWWATDLAYNPVGPVDGVYLEHEAAQTVPYARPSNPSAIGSIVFVSALYA
jgi:hypothetical protein